MEKIPYSSTYQFTERQKMKSPLLLVMTGCATICFFFITMFTYLALDDFYHYQIRMSTTKEKIVKIEELDLIGYEAEDHHKANISYLTTELTILGFQHEKISNFHYFTIKEDEYYHTKIEPKLEKIMEDYRKKLQ